MTVHKLTEDFYEDTYTLIAIHSSLDSYRLAYFLNGVLKIKLSRLPKDLLLGEGAAFAVYESYDETTDLLWNLVANKTNVAVQKQDIALDMFAAPVGVEAHYVLPEYPKVDHLLKIDDGEGSFSKVLDVLKLIKRMPQVITAYELETDQLKSKSNLIFLANA
ncbi:IPExxxVDY family protein [Robertkochia flava]|uniref:IPExxxVDY family protein n=1 Tax=Robertkochia flava TaxID=3447986 RepID=UPI001CC94B92|nr:IPExxxVDY family protein [Robertkochia marina]